EAAAEALEVVVGDLRAHGHALLGGHGAGPAGDRRVPRVEAAGHVGAGDHVQDGLVAGHGPGAERLAAVRVEVDVGGGHAVLLVTSVPPACPVPQDCSTIFAVGIGIRADRWTPGPGRRRLARTRAQ